ncbi:hypothetical protein AB4Z54_69215, partial [Streptomyces sp. MCAF7]
IEPRPGRLREARLVDVDVVADVAVSQQGVKMVIGVPGISSRAQAGLRDQRLHEDSLGLV